MSFRSGYKIKTTKTSKELNNEIDRFIKEVEEKHLSNQAGTVISSVLCKGHNTIIKRINEDSRWGNDTSDIKYNSKIIKIKDNGILNVYVMTSKGESHFKQIKYLKDNRL